MALLYGKTMLFKFKPNVTFFVFFFYFYDISYFTEVKKKKKKKKSAGNKIIRKSIIEQFNAVYFNNLFDQSLYFINGTHTHRFYSKKKSAYIFIGIQTNTHMYIKTKQGSKP